MVSNHSLLLACLLYLDVGSPTTAVENGQGHGWAKRKETAESESQTARFSHGTSTSEVTRQRELWEQVGLGDSYPGCCSCHFVPCLPNVGPAEEQLRRYTCRDRQRRRRHGSHLCQLGVQRTRFFSHQDTDSMNRLLHR